MTSVNYDKILSIATPIAIAVTYALISITIVDETLRQLAYRVLACAFFCNTAFISYTVSKALGRQLRMMRGVAPPRYAFADLSLRDVTSFVDERLIPLVIAYIVGYFMAYFMIHETSLLVYTLGFTYFIVNKLITREVAKHIVNIIGEKAEKPRYIAVIGTVVGLIMYLMLTPALALIEVLS